MTDKELHKLGRREMLQLMLAQGREAEKAKQELADAQERMSQLEESYERLKRRLDDKDAQIHKLRAALQSVQGNPEMHGTAAQAGLPVPDDYYAPPQAPVPQNTAVPQQTAPPPQPVIPQQAMAPPEPAPVQQPPPPVSVPQVQQRRTESAHDARPAKQEPPAAQRHARREQDYYDYLFGPVANQGRQQKERPRYQPPPVSPPQPVPAEPRGQYQQWAAPQTAPQQYSAKPPPQREYYDPSQQYRQPESQPVYHREPPPQGAHFAPEPQAPAVQQVSAVPQYPAEPRFPQQAQDEFIPAPEKEPEKVQMLNVVEIVNGLPVSQNQVLRRSP